MYVGWVRMSFPVTSDKGHDTHLTSYTIAEIGEIKIAGRDNITTYTSRTFFLQAYLILLLLTHCKISSSSSSELLTGTCSPRAWGYRPLYFSDVLQEKKQDYRILCTMIQTKTSHSNNITYIIILPTLCLLDRASSL